MRFNTIRFKLPALIICSFIVSALAVLVVTDKLVTRVIDQSRYTEYEEKVSTLLRVLDSHNERLQRTHREEAYREVFQQMAVRAIDETYYSLEKQQVTSFIVDGAGGEILFSVAQGFELGLGDLPLGQMSGADKGGFDFTAGSGEEAWIFYEKYGPWGWTVGYVLPLRTKYAMAFFLRDTLALVMGVIALAMALILSQMVRRQISPILELTRITSAMARGELDQRIDVNRNDEVGILADSFMAMKDSIRQSMDALAENERFLDKVVENIPNMIIVKDARELRLVRLNKAGEELLGRKREELLGKNDYDLYPAGQAESLARRDMEVLEERQLHEIVEEDIQTAGKGIRKLYTKKIPIMDRDGRPQYLLGISEDITERKRAERQIKQSRDFLQTVIDGFPEVMMVVNRDHSIALANKAAGVTAGKTLPELVGLHCFEVSHQSDEPCGGDNHLCPLEEVVKTKAPVTVEHIHTDVKGKEQYIELVAAPIFDDKGEVVQIIESCRDITDRREAEDAKLQLERQVQHAQKLESLGVLAGGIAHDFNNILMGVLGNAELAMMKMHEENPVHANLKSIESAAVRAADLAKQMLAYSGKGQFIVESVNVNRMVMEMVHLLKTSISKTAVLNLELFEELPHIEADRTQLQQVVMNLITNASEAIGEKSGAITVSTGTMDVSGEYLQDAFADDDVAGGRYLFIEVSDTGCGMDGETRSRIFDPFFTTKFTGRGLGMAATLGIIRGHNGAIKLHSEPGRGTTIRVLFPCGEVVASYVPTRDRVSPEPRQWQGGGTVLVVDDEEAVRDIARGILSRHGFEVLTAQDGVEALNIYREDPDAIAVVLLDMTMPRMGGEETFAEMQKIRPDVKVVLSSGYNEKEATNLFEGKGLAGFIQKPYKVSHLLDKLRQILEPSPTA